MMEAIAQDLGKNVTTDVMSAVERAMSLTQTPRQANVVALCAAMAALGAYVETVVTVTGCPRDSAMTKCLQQLELAMRKAEATMERPS